VHELACRDWTGILAPRRLAFAPAGADVRSVTEFIRDQPNCTYLSFHLPITSK
jgi:hypothetical protein